MSANLQTPVLIGGGGPVGLARAADLGWRGVSCTLVEQNEGTIDHPRANAVNSRSMEFCRRWGIADAVRGAGAPPDFPPTVVYVTSLEGYEIARIERPSHGGAGALANTPVRPQRCNQNWFDPILGDLAAGPCPCHNRSRAPYRGRHRARRGDRLRHRHRTRAHPVVLEVSSRLHLDAAEMPRSDAPGPT